MNGQGNSRWRFAVLPLVMLTFVMRPLMELLGGVSKATILYSLLGLAVVLAVVIVVVGISTWRSVRDA